MSWRVPLGAIANGAQRTIVGRRTCRGQARATQYRTPNAPVVERAWRGLVSVAVRADGELGYVQGVGDQPASSQPVTLRSTRDFGVGAFLLAGSEVMRLGLDLECP